MCGIAGFTVKGNTRNAENKRQVLKGMTDAIAHRGPDAEGSFIDGNVAMGFRRLSIIDLSDRGNQPLFNEDGTIAVTFNGEIYNYQELREELQKCGHIFTTQTDTETLVHGYEQWGEDMLCRLRGMFGFVIYDSRRKRLFGARDFFGIKPLYYAKMGDVFMWGSEIKSFLKHPEFKKELNETALENYLSFQYSPTEETFFKGVYKLPAAHCFIYDLEGAGEPSVKRYWEISFKPDSKPALDDWVKDISEVFKASVEAHKIADVEVGSFLSSGVDSSYVAAEANVDKTFTVGFGEDERYNEIGYAKEFSGYIGKDNYSKVITAEEYWGSLERIQYQMDEPLADPAAVALYFVCGLASEQVKVVLSGEGADEIFGGYNIYHNPADMAAYNKIPRPVRRAVGAAAQKLPHKHGVNFLIRGSQDLQERFIGNAYIFTESERRKLLKISTKAPSPSEITRPFYERCRDCDEVTQMQYLDLHLWMTGDILLKADKMSMAHSLELRVPFLDREVMRLASRIPARYRVTKESTKYAMRLAAREACPPQTADKKKLGFPVPIRVWLKEDKYYELVKEKFTSESAERFFDTKRLVELLDDHRAGHYDNSRKIWTVLTFLIWYGVYFGGGLSTLGA